MRRSFIILLVFFTQICYSADFKTFYSINNFSFNNNNKILSSDYHMEFGEIFTQEIAEGLYLDAGVTKKIISDYSVFTDFRISNDIFGFNIGIFTNFLNDSSKILTPGLNYGLKFIFPGVVLVNLNLNNTIPNTSPLETGVSINNYNIKLGFYIGDAILSGNLESLNNSKGTVLSSISTSSIKYFLNLDLFNKYSFYRISLDMGWHNLKRSVNSLTVTDTTLSGKLDGEYEAGTVYIDSKFTFLFNDFISLDIGFLANLINMPIKGLEPFKSSDFHWGLSTLLKVSI
jgi:hypothetical protein